MTGTIRNSLGTEASEVPARSAGADVREPASHRSARAARVADLSDEELDRWILTRLAMAGVDLSVLPEDDSAAPADQTRILRSARVFLREGVPRLADLDLLPDELPPLVPHSLPGETPSGGATR